METTRMNGDTQLRGRLISTYCIEFRTMDLRATRYVTSQLGQLSRAPLRGRYIEYQLNSAEDIKRECQLYRVADSTMDSTV